MKTVVSGAPRRAIALAEADAGLRDTISVSVLQAHGPWVSGTIPQTDLLAIPGVGAADQRS